MVKSEVTSFLKTSNEEVIKLLEKRIARMSKNSKGISIKGIKVTEDLESWATEKGYKVSGDLLSVS